jgi:hypothetical protein
MINLLNDRPHYKYSANYWLRNLGVLPSGHKSDAILFVKYDSEMFTLVVLKNRRHEPFCAMLITPDFLDIECKVLDISNITRYPLTVDEFTKLQIKSTKTISFARDPNDYFKISHIIELPPDLHEEWKHMFRTLATEDEITTNANGLRIVRISANEVFLTNMDEEKMTNPALTFMHVYRQRNLRKLKEKFKTKMISSYWDKQAFDSNFERRRQEDVEKFKQMQFSADRAELTMALLQFLYV